VISHASILPHLIISTHRVELLRSMALGHLVDTAVKVEEVAHLEEDRWSVGSCRVVQQGGWDLMMALL